MKYEDTTTSTDAVTAHNGRRARVHPKQAASRIQVEGCFGGNAHICAVGQRVFDHLDAVQILCDDKTVA